MNQLEITNKSVEIAKQKHAQLIIETDKLSDAQLATERNYYARTNSGVVLVDTRACQRSHALQKDGSYKVANYRHGTDTEKS